MKENNLQIKTEHETKFHAVSEFMLERYRLGELNPEDKEAVEKKLAAEPGLYSRLEKLDESDRQLRFQYPAEYFKFDETKFNAINKKQFPQRRFARIKIKVPLIAAAILLCIFLPVFIIFRTILDINGLKNNATIAELPNVFPTDRPKGKVPAGSELFIYLKGQETVLANQAMLEEGSTVQLAYTVPAGADYGVIFSIDGRSIVTMHYPYRKGQSPVLASGKRTLLNEAYTLDDAPDYEVFVFVVSGEPLDTNAVLREAEVLADDLRSVNIQNIEERCRIFSAKSGFADCEIETAMVLKQGE